MEKAAATWPNFRSRGNWGGQSVSAIPMVGSNDVFGWPIRGNFRSRGNRGGQSVSTVPMFEVMTFQTANHSTYPESQHVSTENRHPVSLFL